MERANADFKNLLYARLKDENKEPNQWVGVLHYVQYSKNISHHRGIKVPVYFGISPFLSIYTKFYFVAVFEAIQLS